MIHNTNVNIKLVVNQDPKIYIKRASDLNKK